MKHFDELLRQDIADYAGRHDDLIYQAPDLYNLMVYLLDDARLPARLRYLVIAAIAYFILPADIIPEEIEGPYGYVDDIFLCAWVTHEIAVQLGSWQIINENWQGESSIQELIEDILSHEESLIGDKKQRIFKYCGLS
jgi:uncharacterized membrane protein YkvA (DUF1232 family)